MSEKLFNWRYRFYSPTSKELHISSHSANSHRHKLIGRIFPIKLNETPTTSKKEGKKLHSKTFKSFYYLIPDLIEQEREKLWIFTQVFESSRSSSTNNICQAVCSSHSFLYYTRYLLSIMKESPRISKLNKKDFNFFCSKKHIKFQSSGSSNEPQSIYTNESLDN